MKRAGYFILILGIFFCLSPIAILLWVDWFANMHGCRIDENGTHPCIVDGRDWGPTLAGFGLVGWLLIITLPLAGAMGVILAGLGLWDLIRYLRTRR